MDAAADTVAGLGEALDWRLARGAACGAELCVCGAGTARPAADVAGRGEGALLDRRCTPAVACEERGVEDSPGGRRFRERGATFATGEAGVGSVLRAGRGAAGATAGTAAAVAAVTAVGLLAGPEGDGAEKRARSEAMVVVWARGQGEGNACSEVLR